MQATWLCPFFVPALSNCAASQLRKAPAGALKIGCRRDRQRRFVNLESRWHLLRLAELFPPRL